MSWSEVKKINSDFAREPLNFNNYINDISIFGSRSYVLDVENDALWKDLIIHSLVMFGHDAIHETVYNRFTDEDVDYMLRNNGQLGQSFNSFYGVTYFPAGRIDTVLSQLTAESYDVLDPKFKSGIYRYISEKTADNTAGQWLGTIYNIDELKAKTDIASIVSDTDIWTGIIMNNASLRRVISISETTVQYFAANPSDVYVDFITEVCHNTDATISLFTSLSIVNGITDFMNNEAAVTVLTNNRESMIAVTFMTEPFSALLASEVGLNALFNSEVACEVISDSIINVASSESVLSGIKTNLSNIETALPSIADTEKMTAEVIETKNIVSETLNKLSSVSLNTSSLVNNINGLLSNTNTAKILINNTSCMKSLANNEDSMNKLLSSSTLTTLIDNSEVAKSEIYSSNIGVAKYIVKKSGWTEITFKDVPNMDYLCETDNLLVKLSELSYKSSAGILLYSATTAVVKYIIANVAYNNKSWARTKHRDYNSIEDLIEDDTFLSTFLKNSYATSIVCNYNTFFTSQILASEKALAAAAASSIFISRFKTSKFALWSLARSKSPWSTAKRDFIKAVNSSGLEKYTSYTASYPSMFKYKYATYKQQISYGTNISKANAYCTEQYANNCLIIVAVGYYSDDDTHQNTSSAKIYTNGELVASGCLYSYPYFRYKSDYTESKLTHQNAYLTIPETTFASTDRGTVAVAVYEAIDFDITTI